MSQQVLQLVEKSSLKESAPQFAIGDTVDVHTRILEGEKERIQIFSGVVIARAGSGSRETFVVRRIVAGEGVERKFPLHSPKISKIEVKRSGIVRRAKLYYLRDRIGKAVKLRERKAREEQAVPRRIIDPRIRFAMRRRAIFIAWFACLRRLAPRSSTLLSWRRPLSLGEQGERAAATFLRRQGYKIVARGGGRGELDVVAVDGRTLVFVEVKTRRGDQAGAPEAAVDAAKQRRVIRAAERFRRRHELLDHPARFDVVAVTWPAGQRRPKIEHFRGAFDAGEDP